MNIAIIGTGNVGGALATRWAAAGHHIYLGVQDIQQFKGKELLQNKHTSVHTIAEAIAQAEVILVAIPPQAISGIVAPLGDLHGKIIIDATNSVRTSPENYPTVYHYLCDQTKASVVKCFNTTGFENMLNPIYEGKGIDMFMAGDDEKAKAVAKQLAIDGGFDNCYDFGRADKVQLLEQFALSWINLAIMQGMGRDIAFKLISR